MKITVPFGAPVWLPGVLTQIERFLDGLSTPTAPVALPKFSSTNLPPANKYVGHMIWVTDLATPAYSGVDGSGIHYWFRLNGSAI